MAQVDAGIEDLGGKTFPFASIGEAGGNVFPAGADYKKELKMPMSRC